MPSKSRKKLKGQARKAKAKSNATLVIINSVGQNKLNVIDDRGRIGIVTPRNSTFCNHGGLPYDMPTVCVQFITAFYKSIIQLSYTGEANVAIRGLDALQIAFEKFPEAVTNENYRWIMKKNMISNGVASLLGPSWYMALSCAAAIMVIDSYDPSSPISPGNIDERHAKHYLTCMDIICGCHHSMVKYFVKQIPCKCLDELYSQDKANCPKISACTNCKMREERRNMFVCTGCERTIYCSKACQLEDVPTHKESCKAWQNGRYTCL